MPAPLIITHVFPIGFRLVFAFIFPGHIYLLFGNIRPGICTLRGKMSRIREVFPNEVCYTLFTCKRDGENPCSKKNNDYSLAAMAKTVAKAI